MDRKLEFSIDEFYHVYNRGNNKGSIFIDDRDRERFVKLLFLCNGTRPVVFKEIPRSRTLGEIDRGETLVDIGAYCLMPNHFHLLLHEKIENGVSAFLQKLSTAYSLYFNKRHYRTGALFEGRFRAEHADTDEYLKYLFAYIHLNPIKLIDPKWKENGLRDQSRAEAHLAGYKYSSYADHAGSDRQEAAILSKSAFPEYFDTAKDFCECMNDWLDYQAP
ncbi:transposase [Candidatus Peregrinibacteria bacterium]|nr:transposase [Candidatus Peregrinibacteria bacterium]